MAAYAAVISLRHTICALVEDSRVPIVLSTRYLLNCAYIQTTTLKEVLEGFDNSSGSSKRVECLDVQIRDAAHRLEDVLELYESNELCSEGENYEEEDARPTLSLDLEEMIEKIISFTVRAKQMDELCLEDENHEEEGDHAHPTLSLGLEELMQEIISFDERWKKKDAEYQSNELYAEGESYEEEGAHAHLRLSLGLEEEITSFVKRVKKMEAEYMEELLSPVQEDDGDDDCVSLNIDFGVEMVGHQTELMRVRDDLLRRMRPDDMCFFSCFGEAGTRGLLITRTIFEDAYQCFDCCAWVTIGARYQQYRELVIRILDQVVDHDKLCGDEYELLLMEEDEKIICNYLYKSLENRRYMILLDDVRDVQVLDYLRSSFPDQSNGSLVFLTTPRQEIAEYDYCLYHYIARATYIEECSWYLLKIALFGEDASISPELEEVGKIINGNCRGRLLVLAKTLLYLLKTEKTVEQWRKIAAEKENPIFMVEDELSEICKIKTEMQSLNWDMDDPTEECAITMISSWIDYSAGVEEFKKKMHPKRFFSKMQIIYLMGMAGSGKTTYAKKVIQDESVSCHYDHCVWVTLGPKYQAKEILIDILAQIYLSIDKMLMKEDEKNLVKDLCVQLSSKRCLIVLDDLWSTAPLDHLKRLFPDIKGRALVTTRTTDAVDYYEDDILHDIRLLDEEESWCLLCKKVFGGEECPFELEKAGRKIAEKCDGLPLLILTVADELLKIGDMSEEYWKKVASGKEKPVFKNAHDKISKALRPSYMSLQQHLKACFLYLGIFRERYAISVSRLTNLLIDEGFLEPDLLGNIEHFIKESLRDLIRQSVMMMGYGHPGCRMKRCRLHSVFWHLCNTEAAKNKFFHAMDTYEDCSIENMENQRRLCIRNSVLLGFKDVQESMASITSAHSLLCVSPPHQYPVPICFGLGLMRVMDALAIRQYKFPVEVVKLFHLRFLTLTCCGRLPTSISKLWKLQYLIVSQYMSIKSYENSSLLPMEIWYMKELKHLQIMGGRLPNPNPKCGEGLPNLSALLDVSAQSCTQEVLEMIPNLKRLGIRIELAPDEKGDSFDILNNISRLCGLESLKCVVLNPQFRAKMGPPPAPVSMFPSSLKRLSLSGFGYPWEYMSFIAGLRNLEVLKLKSYAFRGPKWVIDCKHPFHMLRYLVIEDTDLVQWEMEVPILVHLECLSIKDCYKLQKLPTTLPGPAFEKLEIIDCNPLTLGWAEQMRKHLLIFPVNATEVVFSWY